jgi:hypothetical protein
MGAENMASEFKKGLGGGFSLFGGELLASALFLTLEATNSATGTIWWIALFTFLISLASFVQSVKAGSEKSGWFLFGFFIGGTFALYLALQLVDPMKAPVIGGIMAEIVGMSIGWFVFR